MNIRRPFACQGDACGPGLVHGGFVNLDPLSLVLNMEANVVVRDRRFTSNLARELESDFADSQLVPLAATQRHWADRMGHWLFRVAAKLYLRLAGISGHY